MKRLKKADVDAIAQTVVAQCKPTMRVVIGDSTPKQHDRADIMARSIDRAVKIALIEIGLYEDKNNNEL